MKGANYSVYSQTFAQEATFTISLKKLRRRLNLLKGSRLSYKTIKCGKKFCLLFSFKVTPPLHHPKNNFMSKWHLIQPLHREITKNQRLSPWFSSGAKIFGHVSHSIELARMCLACQQFDFNSADWISGNVHVISRWYLRTMGKEFIFRLADGNAWRISKNFVGCKYFNTPYSPDC